MSAVKGGFSKLLMKHCWPTLHLYDSWRQTSQEALSARKGGQQTSHEALLAHPSGLRGAEANFLRSKLVLRPTYPPTQRGVLCVQKPPFWCPKGGFELLSKLVVDLWVETVVSIAGGGCGCAGVVGVVVTGEVGHTFFGPPCVPGSSSSSKSHSCSHNFINTLP